MVGYRSFVSILVVGLLALSGPASGQSSTPLHASFSYVFSSGYPCAGDNVTVTDKSEGEIASREWTLNGAVNPYGSGAGFSFTMANVGSYSLALRVKDRSGAVGEYSTTWSAYDCKSGPSASPTGQTAPTGQASPSSSPSGENCYTYEWRDERGNVYRETRCETAPASTYPTAPPASGVCQSLSDERQKYESDWNYRYYAHYKEAGKEPGSDAAFDEKMRSEMETWAGDWKQRWIAAGCDGASDECRSKIEAAKSEFEALRQRYDPLWTDHFSRLEAARREFASSGYHTDAEWKEFETKWAGESQSLSARFEQEAQAIFSKHPGLRECGFYYEYYGGHADYKEQYATPPTVDAYSTQRSECEQRMVRVKETYGPRFEELHLKLRSVAPDSPEYAAIKQQILDLEEIVQKEMEAIAQDCRQGYESSYDRPDTYKQGAGSLACFYDETIRQIRCVGRYVGFNGNPDTQLLSSYTCGGQLYFDQIWANKVFEDFQFSSGEDESQLAIRSSNLKLIFHDGARGVINVGVVEGAEIYFVPSSLFDVRVEGNKVLLDGKDADGAFLGGEGALAWDEVKRSLTVRGEATWVSESCIPTGDKPDGGEDSRYWDAIQKRRLGAQVTIALEGNAVDEKEETYDEGVDVKVEREGGKNKFVAKVDADENCKTIVLKFDAGIFETIKLKVVLTDENGSSIEIRKASNLGDVLEPCGPDEENAFEYWIVLDELGTQVVVSFAHFSEKRVSVEAAATQDIGVPGFGIDLAILGGALAVASVAGMRRRLR